MVKITKYFVNEQLFEAVEDNKVVKVSVQEVVRNTVAGYIFGDKSYDIKMFNRKLVYKDKEVNANIADLGILDIHQDNPIEEGVSDITNLAAWLSARVFLVFVVIGEHLRTLVFQCLPETGVNNVVDMANEAILTTDLDSACNIVNMQAQE